MPLTVAEIKAFLLRALRAEHAAREATDVWPDHEFAPHYLDGGICGVCGWFDPNGPKAPCGHTMREHGTMILEALEQGRLPIGRPVVITYIDLGPRSWPWDVM